MGTIKKEIITTFNRHQEYIEAVKLITQESNGYQSQAEIDVPAAKEVLTSMHQSSIRTSILIEAFDLVLDNNTGEMLSDFPFDKDFIHEARLITAQINDEHFFKNEVLEQLG